MIKYAYLIHACCFNEALCDNLKILKIYFRFQLNLFKISNKNSDIYNAFKLHLIKTTETLWT